MLMANNNIALWSQFIYATAVQQLMANWTLKVDAVKKLIHQSGDELQNVCLCVCLCVPNKTHPSYEWALFPEKLKRDSLFMSPFQKQSQLETDTVWWESADCLLMWSGIFV